MTKIKYISSQILELLKNKYVKNATQKHVIFKKECKIEAVNLWEKWLTSKEVFKELWFPNYIINSYIPKNSLWRWKINIDTLSDQEKIEFLKTENAYLKEMYKIKFWHYP